MNWKLIINSSPLIIFSKSLWCFPFNTCCCNNWKLFVVYLLVGWSPFVCATLGSDLRNMGKRLFICWIMLSKLFALVQLRNGNNKHGISFYYTKEICQRGTHHLWILLKNDTGADSWYFQARTWKIPKLQFIMAVLRIYPVSASIAFV